MRVTGLTVNTMPSKLKLVEHSERRKRSVKNMPFEVYRFEGEDR